MAESNEAKHHILLIEDDSEISDLLSALLIKNGFQVTCCADGSNALETFKNSTFSLVMLDIMLPGIDGYAVCAELRAWEKDRHGRHVPIIFLSALAQKTEIDKGIQSGADAYIKKPYENNYILEQIRKLLSLS